MSATPENIPPSIPKRYKIQYVLGSGAMGIVYKARDTYLGKDVAIKLMKNTGDNQSILRFQKEAKLCGQLSHEYILSALDFGITDEGHPYLVLDYLDGITLSEYIKEKRRLSTAEAIPLIAQICAAMSYAHKKSILHRDLKPANIMLLGLETGSPSVKIMDFGVAKLLNADQNQSAQKLTATGAGLGSPLYMSPEQAQGNNDDKRSDIYSLGCIAYEMLTGTPPIKGESALDTIQLKLTVDAPSLSAALPDLNFPDQLDNIVARSLSRKASARFDSFDAILEAVTKFIDSGVVSDVDLSQLEKTAPPSSENNSHALAKKIAATITILVLAGTAVVFAKKASEHPEPIPVVTQHGDFGGSGYLPPEEPSVNIGGDGISILRATIDRAWLAKETNKWPPRTTCVKFKECKLETPLPEFLKQFPIDSIEIDDCEVGARSLENMDDVRTLKVLRLGKNLAETKESPLKSLPNLQIDCLDIVQENLLDTDLVIIGQMRSLTKLRLVGNGMTAAGVHHLISLDKLDCISFGSNQFDPAFLDTISSLPNLQSVELQGIKAGCLKNGLKQLSTLPKLVSLGFVNSSINGTDLSSLNSLKHLYTMTFRRVEMDGTAVEKILQHPGIRAFEIIDSNRMTEKQILLLARKDKLIRIQLPGSDGIVNNLEEDIIKDNPHLKIEVR